MGAQQNVPGSSPICINDAKSAVSVPNPDLAGILGVADVVGILAKLKRALKNQTRPIKDPESSISCARYVKTIIARVVVYSLRFLKGFYFRCPLPFGYVHNFDRPIPQRGNKDPLTRNIRGEVVNATLHTRERDFSFEPKKCWIALPVRAS